MEWVAAATVGVIIVSTWAMKLANVNHFVYSLQYVNHFVYSGPQQRRKNKIHQKNEVLDMDG